MILDKKSKDLFTEGQRYFDMLRLGKSITFNDDFSDLPITKRDKQLIELFCPFRKTKLMQILNLASNKIQGTKLEYG